jgi:hypothetical protein
MRYPVARIFVGTTSLPEPQTLLEHAVKPICFFYTVAQRMNNPPWGVSANLCVPGRTNNHVWFSKAYPRHGGGEDIEFCIKMKMLVSDGDGV